MAVPPVPGQHAQLLGALPFRKLKIAAAFAPCIDTGRCVREDAVVTIALAKDVEDFLKEQVRAGICTDPQELANNVLRSLREQLRSPLEITPELESWLIESADKPSTPLTQADFDGIRERVQARLHQSEE